MKFTPRQGGKDMANVRLTFSFTAEEIDKFKEMAREAEYGGDWRSWLENQAYDGIYSHLIRVQDEKWEEERYRKERE